MTILKIINYLIVFNDNASGVVIIVLSNNLKTFYTLSYDTCLLMRWYQMILKRKQNML